MSVCLSLCMHVWLCMCVRVCVYIKQHSGSVCLFIVASVAVVVRNRNSICSSMFPFGLVWFGLVSLCHLMTMLEVAIYIACRLTNCQQQFKSISPKEREAKVFAVLSSNTSKVIWRLQSVSERVVYSVDIICIKGFNGLRKGCIYSVHNLDISVVSFTSTHFAAQSTKLFHIRDQICFNFVSHQTYLERERKRERGRLELETHVQHIK